MILIKNKFRIIKNQHNFAELIKLKDEGIKYRNSITQKKIEPSKEFYKIFSEGDVIEIINSLELQKEINQKFTYKGKGAELWDEYYKANAFNDSYPTPNRLINLLRENLDYLLYVLEGSIVNIIDIGQGNSYPIKNFLTSLLTKIKIDKYITVDISSGMNILSKENINLWFPNIETCSYLLDIENDRIDTSIFRHRSESVVNVLLYIGSNIGNHIDKVRVMSNIRNGMRSNDVLLISNTIDNQKNRSDFSPVKNEESTQQDTWILKELGVNLSDCEFVMRYDSSTNTRVLNVKLDQDYELVFKILNVNQKVNFYKGDEITVWRHEMTDIPKFLAEIDRSGLEAIHFSSEKDSSHGLFFLKTKKLQSI